MRLTNCETHSEQVAWAVEHLKQGGRIHDIALWLGGVDRPMMVVAAANQTLRAEGHNVTKAMETVRDAAGEEHSVLVWRIKTEWS